MKAEGFQNANLSQSEKTERLFRAEEIKDAAQFLKVVESCKGRVELVTGEGDL